MSIFNREKSDDGGQSAALKEFRKLKNGDPLPRDGACSIFYHSFANAGETMPFKDKNGYVFFHIENDDVIQEMTAGTPSVGIFSDGERKIISLKFKTGEIINPVDLIFDINNTESRQVLESLKKRKKIELNFLNLVYGQIVKEKNIVIPIPADKIKRLSPA